MGRDFEDAKVMDICIYFQKVYLHFSKLFQTFKGDNEQWQATK